MPAPNTQLSERESHRRSVAKAISWRAVALVVTVSVVWMATREASFAVTVGVADSLIKLFVYYAHERAWIRLHFGKSYKENIKISLMTCSKCHSDLHPGSDEPGKYDSRMLRVYGDYSGEAARPEEKSKGSEKAQDIQAHTAEH